MTTQNLLEPNALLILFRLMTLSVFITLMYLYRYIDIPTISLPDASTLIELIYIYLTMMNSAEIVEF